MSFDLSKGITFACERIEGVPERICYPRSNRNDILLEYFLDCITEQDRFEFEPTAIFRAVNYLYFLWIELFITEDYMSKGTLKDS